MSMISVKGKVTKKMFYNEGFGVYSFVMVASDQEVKRDKVWGTTVVSGKCPHLTEGNVYDFVIEPSTSKKYGDGYAFVSFEAPEVSSVAGQQELLRQSTSENHANTIIKAYPDSMIVDLIKQDKVDVSKLKGIKEKALAKIKDKLIKLEALEHALVELKDLNITVEALERLIEHFGSQEALVEAVKENIYSLTQVSMFGFKRVDEFAMKRGDDPTNDKRIIASFRYIMEEESQKGHTWIGLDSLLPTARDLLNIDVEYIHEQIQMIEEGKKRQFKIVNNRFTLTKYYKMEQDIKSNLDRLMKAFEPFVDEVDIEKIEDKEGITYTDEQRNLITKFTQSGVMIINGLAGSGKSKSLFGALSTLPLDKKYIAIALSGKAVQVLIKNGLEAQTIHSLIGNEEAIQSFDVVVVDESSMVNLELFHTLITNMNDGQQLILVGDNGQLPPIGVGSVFDDLLYSDVYPRQELTKIHRQAAESGIISASHKVRHGNQITTYNQSSKEVFGVNGDMVLFPMERDKIQSNVLSVVSAYFKKHGEKLFEDFMVLTPVKQKGDNSVMLLNNKIQEIVNFSQEEGVKKGITTFVTGDRVIHNGNKDMSKVKDVAEYNYLMKNEMNLTQSTKVYNGTTGRILKIDYENEHILIKWEFHEGVHLYEFKDVKLFDLAYASTIHRSQGMGIKNVVMVLDYIAFNMLSKQLVYTGFTRASEKLVVFCENAALHKAIKTDLGSTRRTFLKEILKGELIE